MADLSCHFDAFDTWKDEFFYRGEHIPAVTLLWCRSITGHRSKHCIIRNPTIVLLLYQISATCPIRIQLVFAFSECWTVVEDILLGKVSSHTWPFSIGWTQNPVHGMCGRRVFPNGGWMYWDVRFMDLSSLPCRMSPLFPLYCRLACAQIGSHHVLAGRMAEGHSSTDKRAMTSWDFL